MKWLLLLGVLILAWLLFLRPRPTSPESPSAAATPTPARVANPYKQSLDRAREVADQVGHQHQQKLPKEP